MEKDDEAWRFEPDTYLVQAFEAHWDAPRVVCKHADTYECARAILEWLGEVHVELVHRGPG